MFRPAHWAGRNYFVGGIGLNGCLVRCRSLTYAQRTVRALDRAGMPARLMRLPTELRDGSGCGYCVALGSTGPGAALQVIRREGLAPVRVFCKAEDGLWQEVGG